MKMVENMSQILAGLLTPTTPVSCHGLGNLPGMLLIQLYKLPKVLK